MTYTNHDFLVTASTMDPAENAMTTLMETTTPALEIPMELADKWDDMLKQKGRSATYWDIACWAYEQGKKHSKEVLR